MDPNFRSSIQSRIQALGLDRDTNQKSEHSTHIPPRPVLLNEESNNNNTTDNTSHTKVIVPPRNKNPPPVRPPPRTTSRSPDISSLSQSSSPPSIPIPSNYNISRNKEAIVGSPSTLSQEQVQQQQQQQEPAAIKKKPEVPPHREHSPITGAGEQVAAIKKKPELPPRRVVVGYESPSPTVVKKKPEPPPRREVHNVVTTNELPNNTSESVSPRIVEGDTASIPSPVINELHRKKPEVVPRNPSPTGIQKPSVPQRLLPPNPALEKLAFSKSFHGITKKSIELNLDKQRPVSVALPQLNKMEEDRDSIKFCGDFILYDPQAKTAQEETNGTVEKAHRKSYRNPDEESKLNSVVHTKEEEQAAIILQKYVSRYIAKKRFRTMKDRAYHRMKCANEILSTEKTYVESLKIISEVYLEPFKKLANGPNPPITKAQITQIFSDIDVILNVNDTFYKDLEQRLSTYRPHTVVSDIFQTMAPFFKTYTRYCNNYDKSQLMLKDVKNHPEMKNILAQMDKDSRTSKLGLASYLILPIQRIPRYRLLLQDLIKHTEKDHPDYANLNKALESILQVAEHLNAAMKGIDATNEIIKIQNMFNSDANFLEPHRRFITGGKLMELKETDKITANGRDLYLHIFNDILVFSQPVSSDQFTYKGEIQLCNAALFNYLSYESGTEGAIFKIVAPASQLILKASSLEEKNKWLQELSKVIAESRSLRKINILNVDTKLVSDETTSTLFIARRADEGEIEVSVAECIQQMKKGTTMLKYCRTGRPHFRTIILSGNERYLLWGSPNKSSHESKVALADVKTLELGQKTHIFLKNKNPQHESLSFSLVYKNRSLDLVAKDRKEYAIWITGINFLLSHIPHNKGNEEDNDETIVLAHDLSKEKQQFKEMFERIGDAYTWGQGARGALGHGDENDQTVPLVMKDFLYLDVSTVACENSAAAAIMLTGELFTWGNGEKGRLGHGDNSDRVKPTLVKGFEKRKLMKVSMGAQHTLALDNAGCVWCFGSSEHGQLGLGADSFGPTAIKSSPVLIPALKNLKVREIACGHWHSACITFKGELLIWGRGEDGQLGLGNKENVPVPTAIPSLKEFKITEAALGLWHSLALTDDGQLWSFGNSTYGQLGHGDTNEQLLPKQIEFLKGKHVVAVAAGSAHSVCILNNGEIYCWGSGIYGQIGNNEKSHAYLPTLVKNLKGDNAVKIACGVNHTLALMESGKVYAWGAGTYGRLGLKNENDQHVPKEITFLSDKSVRTIACGGSQSACVCAHQWVPDKDATQCMDCKVTFTMFKRRHHCRYCGGIFCGNCTTKRKSILRFGFDHPVRVCEYCYQILSEQL